MDWGLNRLLSRGSPSARFAADRAGHQRHPLRRQPSDSPARRVGTRLLRRLRTIAVLREDETYRNRRYRVSSGESDLGMYRRVPLAAPRLCHPPPRLPRVDSREASHRAEKGDPNDDDAWYVTDWMDNRRAQEVPAFQQHCSWQDMINEAGRSAGASNYALRVAAPLIRAILKRRGSTGSSPGTPPTCGARSSARSASFP